MVNVLWVLYYIVLHCFRTLFGIILYYCGELCGGVWGKMPKNVGTMALKYHFPGRGGDMW